MMEGARTYRASTAESCCSGTFEANALKRFLPASRHYHGHRFQRRVPCLTMRALPLPLQGLPAASGAVIELFAVNMPPLMRVVHKGTRHCL